LFDDCHGNKSSKLDLESALCLPDGRLLAFGSGATAAREQLVVLSPSGGARLCDGATLYAALRSAADFSGGELNIEGAVLANETIRFFQRGNASASARNAVGDISLGAFLQWLDGNGAPPSLLGVCQIDLGDAYGVRFGFTDATVTGDGRIAFLACAEDSANAVADGPIVGCRFGLISSDEVSMTDIVDATGERVTLKLEGIESRPADAGHFDVVSDADRADAPALLGTLAVTDSRGQASF
jgi:hypothetical protein